MDFRSSLGAFLASFFDFFSFNNCLYFATPFRLPSARILGPPPLKIELSLKRNAHFHKIALSAVSPFLHLKYTQKEGPKGITNQ